MSLANFFFNSYHLRQDRGLRRPFCFSMGVGLMQEIGDPGTDRFHADVGAFLLQEIKHVEVAVTFGELCPKLTRDFHHRLYARAIYFDGFILPRATCRAFRKSLP